MCVNNLSKVALDSAVAAGIEPATFQSQVQRPNHCATESLLLAVCTATCRREVLSSF